MSIRIPSSYVLVGTSGRVPTPARPCASSASFPVHEIYSLMDREYVNPFNRSLRHRLSRRESFPRLRIGSQRMWSLDCVPSLTHLSQSMQLIDRGSRSLMARQSARYQPPLPRWYRCTIGQVPDAIRRALREKVQPQYGHSSHRPSENHRERATVVSPSWGRIASREDPSPASSADQAAPRVEDPLSSPAGGS